MKYLKLRANKDGSVTVLQNDLQFYIDNNGAELSVDFSSADVSGLRKWCDFEMSDGTTTTRPILLEYTVNDTLTISLDSYITKTGPLKIQPFANDPVTEERINFSTIRVIINDSLNVLNDTAVADPNQLQFILDDYDDRIIALENQPAAVHTLDSLTDVTLVNPRSGDMLVYNSNVLQWENITQSPAFKMTTEGGYAVRLTNKTGVVSVKGTVVRASYNTNYAFERTTDGIPDAIGVIYEDGIADSGECWVVISGIADVLFTTAATRGYLARTFVASEVGYVIGKAKSEQVPQSPFASDKHFCEIGHIIQTTSGAGLAKTILHFN